MEMPCLRLHRHFNPRSREGSDRMYYVPSRSFTISIHAPAKGATSFLNYPNHNIYDFNPRSREGSDCVLFCIVVTRFRFQSTLPRRERHGFLGAVSKVLAISIHAPAKGATSEHIRNSKNLHHFNPRSREGSDREKQYINMMINLFQSTLPRRERRQMPLGNRQFVGISIHAPAKGATKKFQIHVDKNQFQSTLPRRERRIIDPSAEPREIISIHAPAKGATHQTRR